jgi:hypothetical protein
VLHILYVWAMHVTLLLAIVSGEIAYLSEDSLTLPLKKKIKIKIYRAHHPMKKFKGHTQCS